MRAGPFGNGHRVVGGVRRRGFVPRVRHEVEETSTLVTLVAAGLGVAVVPAPTAALDIAGVGYRPLGRQRSESTWSRPTYWTRHRQRLSGRSACCARGFSR